MSVNNHLDKKVYDLLRGYIEEHCSISLNEDKMYLIESRFGPLFRELECSNYYEFYLKAKHDATGIIREKIIDAITTNETLWFRENGMWALLREKVIPGFMKLLRSGAKNKIRIWSAGCSTGQEPYSIAMLIDSMLANVMASDLKPEQFQIIATDISSKVIHQAKEGIYSPMEIARGLDEDFQKRYFRYNELSWQIKDSMRERVKFLKHNLQNRLNELGYFDLILCKNVIIYFNESFKEDLLKRLSKRLDSNGILIVGTAESVSRYSKIFQRELYKNAIYYTPKKPTRVPYKKPNQKQDLPVGVSAS